MQLQSHVAQVQPISMIQKQQRDQTLAVPLQRQKKDAEKAEGPQPWDDRLEQEEQHPLPLVWSCLLAIS